MILWLYEQMNKFFLLYLLLLFVPMNSWAAMVQPQPSPADSPAKLLTGSQLEDYLRVFNYVIETYKDEKPYKWRAGSASGSILVGPEYISKDDATCRTFSEGYVLAGKAGQAQGVACRKEDNTGWCRLTYDDARTCDPKKPGAVTEDPYAGEEPATDEDN